MENNVILIGGAFNPITKGHILLGELLLDKFPGYEVWYVLSKNHPDGKDLVEFDIRFDMIQQVIKDNMRVCMVENLYNLSGYTYDTVKTLNDKFDNYNFKYYVIGSDRLETLNTWNNIDKLKELIKFITIERSGYEKIPYDIEFKPKINYSSTDVRKLIQVQVDDSLILELIDEKVLDIIKEYNLYE